MNDESTTALHVVDNTVRAAALATAVRDRAQKVLLAVNAGDWYEAENQAEALCDSGLELYELVVGVAKQEASK